MFLTITQLSLAIGLLAAGLPKLLRSRERIVAAMPVLADFSAAWIRVIGGIEFVAAAGLLAAQAGGALAPVAPVAAAGISLLLVGAIAAHLRRGELLQAVPAFLMLGLATCVGVAGAV